MDRHGKQIRTLSEVLQWTILLFCLIACVIVCPNVKNYIDGDKAESLYRQINADQQIERLNRENLKLIDSIANLKKDTVYVYKRKR